MFNKMKKDFLLLSLMLVSLAFTGCLISATFVIYKTYNFSVNQGFYYVQVDITDDETWQDHKEEIDNIDFVGFELWINNNGTGDVTFEAYIDEYTNTLCTDLTCFGSNSTKIQVIDNLTVSPGSTYISYGNSFQYVINQDDLKRLTKEGQFNFYGTSDASVNQLIIDSFKVIVTLSVS